MVEAEKFDDADTIRQAKDELVKARVSTYKQVEDELEKHGGTLVEELFGADVGPTLKDSHENGSEDPVRENRRPGHELTEKPGPNGRGEDDGE